MDNYNYGAVQNQPPKVKASGWVTLLRAVAIAGIVLGCLISVIAGVSLMFTATKEFAGLAVAVGILVIIVGVAMSFVSAASIMVLLDVASDIRTIRVMTERKQ